MAKVPHSHQTSYPRINITLGHRTGYSKWKVTWPQIWLWYKSHQCPQWLHTQVSAHFCHLDAVSCCVQASQEHSPRPAGLLGPYPCACSPPQPPRKGTAGKLPTGNGPSTALPSQQHTSLGWNRLPSHQQKLQQLTSTENSTPAPRSAWTWKYKCKWVLPWRTAEWIKDKRTEGTKSTNLRWRFSADFTTAVASSFSCFFTTWLIKLVASLLQGFRNIKKKKKRAAQYNIWDKVVGTRYYYTHLGELDARVKS